MKKHILITGSTDGIGKLAAAKLAKDSHEIYLHGRNPEKLSTVIAEIKASSNKDSIKGFVADLSDLDAVRQLAQQIKSEVSTIDVLINNAGVFNSPATLNKNGLDMRFVVNYLASYVLTNELLSLIKKGTNPRIINLSSAAQASISYDVLSGGSQASAQDTYAQSKLALTMWSFHLADVLDEVSVIAVNPGSLLNTNMVKEAYGRYWSSADKGADILYDLAVGADYEGLTGKYFDNDKGSFARAHPDVYNQSDIDKLIDATEAVIKTV